VYWDNLSIPFVSLTVRRLIVAVAFFFLNFFYVIPIAFVQSLANIEGIEKAAPFLKPLIEEYVYFNMPYLLHNFFFLIFSSTAVVILLVLNFPYVGHICLCHFA